MSEPHIAKREPAGLTLEPGTYWWCACGLSEKQPFCDGHHKGTEFHPHTGTSLGRDHTLYARVPGVVGFGRRHGKRVITVTPAE